MSTQLTIPQPARPKIDKAYITALAILDPTLAYEDLRNNCQTVREAVTLVVDAVLCKNWQAMHTYFEYKGIFPYIECKFLDQEIDVYEQAESGVITQEVDGKISIFMECGDNFTYEDATMKKIRARVIDLFFALAIIHEQKKAAYEADLVKNGLPF